MGKNKRKIIQQGGHANTSMIEASVESETAVVRRDVVQTVIVNLIFLALLIGLYYWNKAAGEPLNELVAKFIKI